MSSPNSHVEVLPPRVVVLGDRAFGGRFGPEGGALMNWISALINKSPESSFTPSAMNQAVGPHRH